MLDSCAAEMDEFQSFLSMVEPSYWGTGYRMNLARFGDYVTMLSNFMISCNSNFQFFSIGSDSTIDSFFDASHWNGLFVEADDKNIRILKGEIAARRATHRSVVLHAAAVDICDSHMIQFARPREDADAGRDGHLLKRSIGRVLVRGIQELPPAKRNRWVVDLVPCYTADQILSEWENSSPVSTHTPGSK